MLVVIAQRAVLAFGGAMASRVPFSHA